jgi:spermidine/putrescine transport system substrate-binding protein
MQVPVGAPHAYTAEKLMDFYYQPEIAAQVADYIEYVPPVKGAKEILAKKDPAVGHSPLVFPNLSNAHNFKTFSPADEAKIDAAFERAIGA